MVSEGIFLPLIKNCHKKDMSSSNLSKYSIDKGKITLIVAELRRSWYTELHEHTRISALSQSLNLPKRRFHQKFYWQNSDYLEPNFLFFYIQLLNKNTPTPMLAGEGYHMGSNRNFNDIIAGTRLKYKISNCWLILTENLEFIYG